MSVCVSVCLCVCVSTGESFICRTCSRALSPCQFSRPTRHSPTQTQTQERIRKVLLPGRREEEEEVEELIGVDDGRRSTAAGGEEEEKHKEKA